MQGPAHFNVKQESYREKIGNERRASIAHEGKGNTRDGKQTYGHTDIEDDVKCDRADQPESKKKTKPVSGPESNI